MALIDIHSHILPGMDDGAKDLEHSLAMARLAVNDGIVTMVATPHFVRGTFEPSKAEIYDNVARLNRSLERNGINLSILCGAEYRFESDLPRRLADGELMTINDSGYYLLVEMPGLFIPGKAEQILYEIQLQGVTPIIAHPERNQTLAGNAGLLKSFVNRGVLSQVTSASVIGLFGRKIQKVAWDMIEVGAIHLLASDGHSTNGRAPMLSPAVKQIQRRWGSDFAQGIAQINPARVIFGDKVEDIRKPNKKSLFSSLLGFGN